MAVFRVNKATDYTTVSTQHLQNRDLSLKAKGLLTLMLSLPNNWDYSVMGLVALSKDGRDSVMSTLSELSDNGYISIESFRNGKGQYESIYNVYEKPNRKNRIGKTESEKPTQYNIKTKDKNNIPSVNNSKELLTSSNGEDTPDEEFVRWYTLYDKKVGKQNAWKMWKRLTKTQKEEIFERTPAYVASTPDVKYRMNPATYINPTNKRWQDEVIQQPNNSNYGNDRKSIGQSSQEPERKRSYDYGTVIKDLFG